MAPENPLAYDATTQTRDSSNRKLANKRQAVLEARFNKTVMGRVMPHSPEAESSTLGGCMSGGPNVQQVQRLFGDIFQPFYITRNQEIWEAILALQDRGLGVDVIAITEELKQRGTLDAVGGVGYVTSLGMQTPTVANLLTHARIVTERAIQRQTLLVLLDSLDRVSQPGADAFRELDVVKERLFNVPVAHLGSAHSDGVKDRSQILARVMEQALDSSTIPVIRTGITPLDRAFGGWRKGELIVMAGRPGSGKTALATTCSMNATGLGLYAPAAGPSRVVLFEYEMAERQIWNRVLANLARVNISRFDDPDNRWSGAEEKALVAAISRIEASGLFIDTVAGHTLPGFRQRCETLVAKHGIQMVVIDQSNKIKLGERTNSRQEEVEKVYVGLKQLAKELDIPIISLAQLNRLCESRNPDMPRPQLSDLRESGGIEQETDLVLMTFRPEDYGISSFEDGTDSTSRGDVQIEKHRNGKKDSARLAYLGWLARWEAIGNTALFAQD